MDDGQLYVVGQPGVQLHHCLIKDGGLFGLDLVEDIFKQRRHLYPADNYKKNKLRIGTRHTVP